MAGSVPRLVIAAPASGSGKTTVATGLMAALTAEGLDVSPHKVGPDYIDPGYHALAAGRPGRNLDPWLTSEELVAPLFLHGARGADIAVIEGVMGLFDGATVTEPPRPDRDRPASTRGGGQSPPAQGDHPTSIVQPAHQARKVEWRSGDNQGFASTAHVAKLLGAPVVLVVDASSAGRSVAALVHGFVTYDPGVRIGGVILNRIGSDRHEQICRAAIEETGLPVLGVLRRRDDAATPSRHLGLIPAAERRPEALATVERLGALAKETCDLRALVALAHTAAPLSAGPWDAPHAAAPLAAGPWDPAATAPLSDRPWAPATTTAPLSGRPADLAVTEPATAAPARPAAVVPAGQGSAPPRGVRIAVAGGPAFTFGYAENEELLAAAGAEVVRFDPLRDESLPSGTRGIVIGGGFPEAYAAELSANEPLRREVAAFTGPVYAECAGLLYLSKSLDGAPMCGVLDAEARMTERLTLGYRAAVAVGDSPVARSGERVRGHEFHRTTVRRGEGTSAAWQWSPGGPDGFATRNCLASYLHLHWAGTPQMARRLVGACG